MGSPMSQKTNNTRKAPTRRKPTPRGAAKGGSRPAAQGPKRTPAKGTRRSVKKSTDSGTARATAAPKRKRGRKAIAIVVVLVLLVGALALLNVYCQNSNNKLKLCEHWRSTVRQACLDTNLDEQWVDSLLALMAVESGGKVDVTSVEGVEGDVMQAAEGAYGDIVKKGSRKYGVTAETPEASIYAGALEFKQNLKLWKKYLKGVGVSETGEIQLIVQGYNFGADGWYNWCKKNKVKTYTVEKAQEYSDTMMPENAKGTPTHGEKWLGFYKIIHG